MNIRYSLLLLILFAVCSVDARSEAPDSMKHVSLSEVVVSESYHRQQQKMTALTIDVVRKDFLNRHFTGNLVQTMEKIPGVRSMDIGAGFSKPAIRGLGFNRIVVSENGIKQEGQQWGSDHGLEIDAFNVEEIRVRKGSSSLIFGSDAMGGVIEILPAMWPAVDQLFGEAVILSKSLNGTLGGSLMLGLRKGAWLVRARFSEQRYGDYRIPADTIVYLTRKIPVYGRRLKNTAGMERNASFFGGYRRNRYRMNVTVSNAFQKMGFFPGAHGAPDLSRLQDDGNSRDIALPYSLVNHFKVMTHQQYTPDDLILSADFGYQYNHREEWSAFHTHYDAQLPPAQDPDKELEFRLHTFSGALKARLLHHLSWEHTAGLDVQAQKNDIAGYAFLLPEYTRFAAGGYWLSTYRPTHEFALNGGARYDFGKIDIAPSDDPFLGEYLRRQGYINEQVKRYKQRSYDVNRIFGDYSFSAGIVWNPSPLHLFKANIGRSFRLPGANELASNGVHHGTFRHEQGDVTLRSERGWQFDASYSLTRPGLELTVSPFVSLFDRYIYLQPTGEWSALPHAGQVYRYTPARALFAGGEIAFDLDLSRGLHYRFAGEYVYTRNRDTHTALNFSPPLSIRQTLSWGFKRFRSYVEWQNIVAQHRIARNEDATPGAQLLHAGASMDFAVAGMMVELSLSIRNLFDAKYFNHLSFYRKVEIPEPGRNFQLYIKVPFNQLLK